MRSPRLGSSPRLSACASVLCVYFKEKLPLVVVDLAACRLLKAWGMQAKKREPRWRPYQMIATWFPDDDPPLPWAAVLCDERPASCAREEPSRVLEQFILPQAGPKPPQRFLANPSRVHHPPCHTLWDILRLSHTLGCTSGALHRFQRWAWGRAKGWVSRGSA